MRNLAALVSALVAGTITVAQAAAPSFIFSAIADPNVYPVLDKYFRSTDFVDIRMLSADQHLSQLLDRAHQVDLADTIGRIQADLDLGCGAGSPGTIWYQPTIGPYDLASSPNSIASATNRIHSSGCSLAGILPSAEFWGYTGACQFNLAGSGGRLPARLPVESKHGAQIQYGSELGNGAGRFTLDRALNSRFRKW
jgi:hypothetical protein